VFEDLGTFTLARGIRRIEQAKEEANRIENRKARSRRTSVEQEAPHEEKSRLLREEGQDDEEDADTVSTEPPTSTTPGSASVSGSTPISEKAKGKMRERRSTSSDITVDRAAAAAIGRNGFVPTQEWVCYFAPSSSVRLTDFFSFIKGHIMAGRVSSVFSPRTNCMLIYLKPLKASHLIPSCC